MRSPFFLSLQRARVAQTGDSVVSECHMRCALQGARNRTALDKKIKDCGLVH